MQHQIIRIATLGVTGFDSPVAFNSVEEAEFSIEGIEEFYTLYCELNKQVLNPDLIKLFEKAKQFAKSNNDFDTFNRLGFIKNHLMPMSIAFENEFKVVIDQTPN